MAYYSNERPTPTVRGIVKFINPNSSIDKTALECSMWKHTLKIDIFPVIESGASNKTDDIKVDRKNGLAIYLVPTKAIELAKLLRKHLENPDLYKSLGICTKTSDCLITIETGENFNNHPEVKHVLVIRHLKEDGVVKASYAYEFNQNYHMAIMNYDKRNGSFEKDYEEFKNIEIEALIDQLEHYYYASTNAYAFANINLQYPYLDKMAMSMGLDLNSNSGKQNSGGSSYFYSNSGDGIENQSQDQYTTVTENTMPF